MGLYIALYKFRDMIILVPMIGFGPGQQTGGSAWIYTQCSITLGTANVCAVFFNVIKRTKKFRELTCFL